MIKRIITTDGGLIPVRESASGDDIGARVYNGKDVGDV